MTRVGVLLPARIETRFDERGPEQTWRLRLIVVPAQPWFDRHDPRVSETELDLLRQATVAAAGHLRGVGGPGGAGAAAFERLAAQVGPGRATWLVDTLVESSADGGWRIRDPEALRPQGAEPSPSVVRDLPPELQVWAHVGGDPPREVLFTILHPRDELHFVPPARGAAPTFWPRWGALRRAGLAGVVHLATVDPDGGPVDPHAIELLTVVGLGEADPSALFTAHVRAGDAALLAPGTPTNVTPEAAHPRPPAASWQATLRAPAAGGTSVARADVSAALLGDAAALPELPGGKRDHRFVQHQLVTALWPALWGHALVDLWGAPEGDGRGGLRAGRWWAEHLLPEGPLPTLLVDDQPYGLLPATSMCGPLGGAADEAPGAERLAARAMEALLGTAAARAERGAGTVVDADQDGVRTVLGQTATSSAYAYRWTVPARLLPDPLPEAHERLAEPALSALGTAASEGLQPQVAVGYAGRVPLPLVDPGPRPDGEMPEGVRQILEELAAENMADFHHLEALDPEAPPSWHRVPLFWLWHRAEGEAPEPGSGDFYALLDRLEGELERPVGDRPHTLLLWLAVHALVVAHAWDPQDGEAVDRYRATLDALHELALRPEESVGTLERVLRATLDCATHRVDAVPSGVASARLGAMGAAPRVLGLYGWVERPLRGEPGFSDRGLVLAPSDTQAKAAAIVRDRFVAHRASGEQPADAWNLELDSVRVRRARGVIEAVRAGAHPGEALGRSVEACFRLDAQIRALRSGYPQDGDAPQRRTCDGLALLRDLSRNPDRFRNRTGLDPAAFDQDTTAALRELAAVPGDVADLHLLEAIHDTVQGGTAASMAALDALAGLGAGPELRALATPLAGTTLRTRVLLALPGVPEPVPAPLEDRPALADPATAALLDSLADPAALGWRTQTGTVLFTLADLGLLPSDLAVVDDVALAAVTRAMTVPEALTPPVQLAELRRIVALLRRCGESDVAPSDPAPLRARYARLHAAGLTLLAALQEAPPDDQDPRLRRWALRWGLAGPPTHAAAVLAEHLAACPAPDAVSDVVAALRALAAVGRGSAGELAVPVLVSPAAGVLPDGLAAAPDEPTWRAAMARVRPLLAELGELAPALATTALADGAGPHWTGRAEPGAAGVPGDARVLTVAHALGAAQLGTAVVGVLDSWQEVLPGRWEAGQPEATTVGATAAFGFQAPAARAPQAILLAVPPAPETSLDLPVVRAIVTEARLLAHARTLRGRDLGPLGALLPSAVLPAGGWSGAVLTGDRSWREQDAWAGMHVRLEQAAPEGDLDRALRAELADPLWMLARQWQLGEHQGENASSPVLARARVRHTALTAPVERPFADPALMPGEAVLEAAAEDWWSAAEGTNDPYDPETFVHNTALRGGGARFVVSGHDGGPADWWSLDVAGTFRARGQTQTVAAVPGRMLYPGAPAPGWCTLEHPDDVVTSHLPDAAHVGSLFFLDVLAGHATDWYLLPLPTPPGHVLTLRGLTVVDVFGEAWALPAQTWAELDAEPWRLFRTTGLSTRHLLVWGATPPPLEGPVLEQVLLGVDEDANLLWAVEEVVEGAASDGAGAPEPEELAWAVDNAAPRVRYRALGAAPARWHPYPVTDVTAQDAPRRRFRQGRLRTPGPAEFSPLPARTSRLLRPRPGDDVHEVDPTAVPAGGVVVERRWVLARALDGAPVLWQQRRRRTPLAAPAHRLAFDVNVPDPG